MDNGIYVEAVSQVIQYYGRKISRKLCKQDIYRFNRLVLFPIPEYLEREGVLIENLKTMRSEQFVKPKADEYWSNRFPGFRRIRNFYPHLEARFVYFLLYGIDIHYDTRNVKIEEIDKHLDRNYFTFDFYEQDFEIENQNNVGNACESGGTKGKQLKRKEIEVLKSSVIMYYMHMLLFHCSKEKEEKHGKKKFGYDVAGPSTQTEELCDIEYFVNPEENEWITTVKKGFITIHMNSYIYNIYI